MVRIDANSDCYNLASDEMRKHRLLANAVGRFRLCVNREIGMKAEGDAGHWPIGVHSRHAPDAIHLRSRIFAPGKLWLAAEVTLPLASPKGGPCR